MDRVILAEPSSSNARVLSSRSVTAAALLLVVAIMLVVLVKLGFWQLDRAAEKAAIKASFEARTAGQPIVLDGQPLDAEQHAFFRVEARGEYEPQYQVLIDNAIRDGRAGYRVVTPFRLTGTHTRVLVDRGWIPGTLDRRDVPAAPAPVGTLDIAGLLERPADDFFTLEDSPPTAGQRVWQNLDMDHYRALNDFPLQPLVLRLSPDASNAGGFDRRWPEYTDQWIARHRGYAVTWFGLAAVLAAGVITLLWRRKRDDA